jgi:hypothetical protein
VNGQEKKENPKNDGEELCGLRFERHINQNKIPQAWY